MIRTLCGVVKPGAFDCGRSKDGFLGRHAETQSSPRDVVTAQTDVHVVTAIVFRLVEFLKRNEKRSTLFEDVWIFYLGMFHDLINSSIRNMNCILINGKILKLVVYYSYQRGLLMHVLDLLTH